MNWIDIVWPMIGATSLTMGLVHLFVWFQRRREFEYLVFSVVALLVTAMSVLELLAMNQDSAATYAGLLRWGHVPFALTMVLLIVFVHLRFRAGSRWLFHGSWLSRAAALSANFLTGANLNFASIESLRSVDILGDTISVPVGQANPWMVLGQLAQILLAAYMVSVFLEVRRRGDPVQTRGALIVCGSVVAFVIASNLIIVLVALGLIHAPVMVSVTFLAVVLATSYGLVGDVVRAGLLSQELSDSQRRLGETEGRLQLAARAGGLGLWTWNIDGDDSWFLPTGHELLQLAPGEPIGWEKLVAHAHPDDRHVLRAARLSALQSGLFSCEFRLGNHDEGPRWLAADGRMDAGPGNASRVVRGVLMDVTERKLAERQREELSHLSRVAIVGELTGTLAHELNQPLTAILSDAQSAERLLALDPPELAEALDCLAHIIENDQRASDVIRGVRGMLRKDTVKHARVDINELIRDVLQLVSRELQKRNVEVRLELAPAMSPVTGDSVQIRQVLLNLLMNASEALATRPTGRRVMIVSRQESAMQVEVVVSDNGEGIAAADLEHVFTAFVTSKASGLGLGLAICRNIVQAHGGTLRAVHGPEGGASFHLRLPLAAEGANA